MTDAPLHLRWALTSALRERADAYMQAHPPACFAHDTAWRSTLWDCYRIPTPTLIAQRADKIVGAAPLSLLLNPLTGPYAVIGPFASYGDVLADTPEIAAAVLQHAARDLGRMGIRSVRIRSTAGAISAAPMHERAQAERFISPRVDIREGERAVWDRKLETRARNAVRKARNVGVRVAQVDELSQMMSVIDAGNRRLGSPFHGIRYFQLLQKHFGSRLQCWVATASGKPAAAAVSLIDRGGLYYVYGQNIAELRSTAANALLVWQMIELACARGLAYVDLGRSETSSPHQRFKRQWGAVDRPVFDLCVATRGSSLPDLTPSNPEFSRMQTTWSRLPLWVTKRLGPVVIRGFG